MKLVVQLCTSRGFAQLVLHLSIVNKFSLPNFFYKLTSLLNGVLKAVNYVQYVTTALRHIEFI